MYYNTMYWNRLMVFRRDVYWWKRSLYTVQMCFSDWGSQDTPSRKFAERKKQNIYDLQSAQGERIIITTVTVQGFSTPRKWKGVSLKQDSDLLSPFLDPCPWCPIFRFTHHPRGNPWWYSRNCRLSKKSSIISILLFQLLLTFTIQHILNLDFHSQ